jgi:hypothetical protein
MFGEASFSCCGKCVKCLLRVVFTVKLYAGSESFGHLKNCPECLVHYGLSYNGQLSYTLHSLQADKTKELWKRAINLIPKLAGTARRLRILLG